MSQTPSHRRREGREDFCPDTDPAEICPYKDPYKRDDWLDGWRQAEREYEQRNFQEVSEEDRLRAIISEVHSWAGCASIATPEDMMQNIDRIIEITNPDYEG